MPLDKAGVNDKPQQGEEEDDEIGAIYERETWPRKMDFLLSCIGYAVGLGNVWRFPYLCFKNGGASFLIPYFVCLVFCGIPIFYLEVAVGQYLSLGTIGVWSAICPMLKGVGYAMVALSFLGSAYYNVVIAWSMFYMFDAFRSDVPWGGCDNWWNTASCKADRVFHEKFNCSLLDLPANCTNKYVSPSEEYFNRYVLKLSGDIGKAGEVQFGLSMCLLVAWIAVFLCVWKGIKSSGKVVYFTATFPYLVLVILLIRGVTLPGAADGVLFYLKPDFSRLKDPIVWMDAAGQIFYSLSVGFGGLSTYGSFNKFHNNCQMDTLIVSIINCGTSIFAGFVIFSMMGYMAYVLNTDVANVVKGGPGLAFIAYPEGISKMPVSPLWAFLFFFMLFNLGLDSQFVGLETIVTGIVDKYAKALRPRKIYLILALCVVEYLIGLSMVTEGGLYVFEMFNYQSGGISLIFIAVVEAYIIGWAYGTENFSRNIEAMIGKRPNLYYVVCWKYIAPFIITIIFIWSLVTWEGISVGDYIFPPWAEFLGWVVALSSILWVPGFAIYEYIKAEGSFTERLRKILTPDMAVLRRVERKNGLKPLYEKNDDSGPFLDDKEGTF